jgi:hypothetical protein
VFVWIPILLEDTVPYLMINYGELVSFTRWIVSILFN